MDTSELLTGPAAAAKRPGRLRPRDAKRRLKTECRAADARGRGLPRGAAKILCRAWEWMRAHAWLTGAGGGAGETGVGGAYESAEAGVDGSGEPMLIVRVGAETYSAPKKTDLPGPEDLRRDAALHLAEELHVRRVWRRTWTPSGDEPEREPEELEYRIVLTAQPPPSEAPYMARVELWARGRMTQAGPTVDGDSARLRAFGRYQDPEWPTEPSKELPADGTAAEILEWTAKAVVECWSLELWREKRRRDAKWPNA